MARSYAPARRRLFLIVGGTVVAIAIVLSMLSGFYVDLLWFQEVGFSGVFWTVLWTKVALGLIFGIVFFVVLLANLLIVRRLTPRFRLPASPEQELIERYRASFEPYARFLVPALTAFLALLVGLAAAAQWRTFLLWRGSGGVAFGRDLLDPLFQRDPAFYIFNLPFQKFVQGWLFSSLVGITVLVGVAHYLSGNIRTQTAGEKVTPQVKAHLSVLLGLIVLVKAWGYHLGKFDLLVSPRGVVTGASYTDVKAQLPALKLLVFIAIVCGILFLVNIRFRGWALPVLGIGLLALTSIIAGAVVPAGVQKFSVDPQELQRERVFIQRNIDATRFAFGLQRLESEVTEVDEEVVAEDFEENVETTANIRLWDPTILRVNFANLQRLRQYYEFHDVDVDRYPIDGEERVVMLSPREISQDGLSEGGTWQNRHLFYTHGYGAVASTVNNVSGEGGPVFVLKDIPPKDQGIALDPVRGAQIYYGEKSDVPFVVVRTQQREFNYPSGGADVQTTYEGAGGIEIGGFFRKLVFAYRYRDFNLLISGLIDSDSRILIRRDIESRVQDAAPFLQYDWDPYAAIVDGRIVFIWDAYTTTNLYPYSDRIDLQEATEGATSSTTTLGGLRGEANYIRNSVKVVMDAYDGTVRFYVVDPTDPLIQVWRNVFPDLFETDPAPPELLAHFRYPENLMQVQAEQFSQYHVTEPEAFYSRENFWALPGDPTINIGSTEQVENPTLRPYYVRLRLPGETEESFVLFIPMTPSNRQNMVAYLAASSEVGEDGAFGRVQAFEFAQTGENIDGPQQVFARINQDPTFSRERSLLDQQGSRVVFGNLLVVPIEDSFVYVLPVFVVSQGNPIPELKFVAAVAGDNVVLGDDLNEALEALGGGGEPPPPPPDGGGTIEELIAEALNHFQAADTALRSGDLATYQQEIAAARDAVTRAQEALGGTDIGGGTPTPTPTASPTA